MRFGVRELIFLAVLLAVPVASYVFVFKPRNVEIRRAEEEVEVKRARLEQLHQVTTRIDDLGLAIEDWRKAIEEIEAKLPSARGIEDILEQVWILTDRNGLQILGTHTEDPVPAATYMELPFKIEIFGNFDGFYQFLLELEQLPRITRIHQMKIVRAGDGRKRRPANGATEYPEGTMEAEFVLSIYYQPNDGETEGSE